MKPLLLALLVIAGTLPARAQSAEAWIDHASWLGRYAKWRAAAEAQLHAVDMLEEEGRGARRERAVASLVLTRYRLNAGDAKGALAALAEAPAAARGSLAAAWLRAEAAPGALPSAAPQAIDREAAPLLYCAADAPTAGEIGAYLQGRRHLLAGNGQQALDVLAGAGDLPDAEMLRALAEEQLGRGAAAMARLKRMLAAPLPPRGNCPGTLPDRVAYNAANVAARAGLRDEAIPLYETAIAAAEARETAFRELVNAQLSQMPYAARAIFAAAMRDPREALPEARNNLGHLLLESSEDEARVRALDLFKAAIDSRDYATKQYAWLGRAQAELAAGDAAAAAESVGAAIWIDPTYQDALDLAATIARDADADTAARAGVALRMAALEALPQQLTESRYGSALDAATEKAMAAAPDVEGAQYYLALSELAEGRLEEAEARLRAARSRFTASLWPVALLGEVQAESDQSGSGLASFGVLGKAVAEHGRVSMGDAYALRYTLPTWGDLAFEAGATTTRLITDSALRNLVERVPWSERMPKLDTIVGLSKIGSGGTRILSSFGTDDDYRIPTDDSVAGWGLLASTSIGRRGIAAYAAAGGDALIVVPEILDASAEVTYEPQRANTQPLAVPRERQDERELAQGVVAVSGPLVKDLLSVQLRVRADEEDGIGGAPSPFASTRSVLDGSVRLSGRHKAFQYQLTGDRERESRAGGLEDVAGALFGDATSTDRTASRRTSRGGLETALVFGKSAYADLRLASASTRSTLGADSQAGELLPQVRSVRDRHFSTGGVGFMHDERSDRRSTAAASFTLQYGLNEFKTGIADAREENVVHDRLSGGALIEAQNGGTRIRRSWYALAPAGEVRERFRDTVTAAYLQDHISLTDFTINAGVRVERQQSRLANGVPMETSVLQPRLGVTWTRDPWTLSGFYGRFAEILDAHERIGFGTQRRFLVEAERIGWWPFGAGALVHGGVEAVDPNLRGGARELFEVGVRRPVGPVEAALKAGRQRLLEKIEDFYCRSERRCIGNPGRGIMTTFTSTRSSEPVPIPAARSDFDYADLAVRDSSNRGWASWQWDLAYRWSRARGNIEPPGFTRIVGIDPYAQTAFDFADTTSPVAPLSFDRRHQLSFQGLITTLLTDRQRISAGLTSFWHTGAPIGAFGYSDAYGRYVYFAEPRGALGRMPAAYDASTQVTYGFQRHSTLVEVTVALDNILNRQTPLVADQRVNFSEVDPSPNPTFLEPMQRTGARTTRLLARIRF
jgi:tetratricopeptide (TPR) repeat protein